VSRLTGVPFSFTAHARDIFEYGDRRSLRDKTQAAKAVIAISEDGRQRLIELAGPEAADKIHLVRNGIDLTHFRRRTRNASGERILAVSRLVPKKGLDTLLRAVAMLVDRGRDVRCQIVGDGPLHDELRKAAKDLRIADRVEFSGSLDAGAVLGAYRHATVVALPCRTDENGDRDGLPVSIVEAMAVGVPVVSTRISGIPEVVEDGVSGLLVEPDDMRGLAAALERVLDDSKLRRSLADAGWCVAQDFDRRITTAELIAALGLPEPAPRTIRLDDVAVTDHVDLTEVVASAD
jgi:glycosyltransferase involved in cell wall biosynthesis